MKHVRFFDWMIFEKSQTYLLISYIIYIFYTVMYILYSSFVRQLGTDQYRNYEEIRRLSLSLILYIYLLHYAEVAGGFTCPAAGEVSGASGSFSRHAHPEDCRKYYICLEGIAREYGCPIGTVFKIGDADGSGACEDPEDVPGWWAIFVIYTIFPRSLNCAEMNKLREWLRSFERIEKKDRNKFLGKEVEDRIKKTLFNLFQRSFFFCKLFIIIFAQS